MRDRAPGPGDRRIPLGRDKVSLGAPLQRSYAEEMVPVAPSVFLAAALILGATGAPLAVTDGWARATPPGAVNGAGYLIVQNPGPAADRIVAVTSPVARRTELHSMSMAGGKMTMRALDEGLEIPAGGTVKLAPGGLHLMFLDLTAPLVAGQKIPVTLELQKAGKITVELVVQPIGAKGLGGP